MIEARLVVLAAAMILDRIVGDPQGLWTRLPHPVALSGTVIGWLDKALNDTTLLFVVRRRRGVWAVACLVSGSVIAGLALEAGFAAIPLGIVLEVLAVTVLLAQKSLVDHVRRVAEGLDRSIQDGRAAVAMIVGRDTTVLDEAGVARAAIESAAENFSDGLVAPAFWFALFGLPGLLAFKVVSTADSMIGHRSARHEAFGWAAARLDDVLNLAPARLSALLIACAAALVGGAPGTATRRALRDARGHRSPNAGWPEAAAAGALGLALGGPRRYGELVVDGAWLNREGRRDAGAADIHRAVRLIDVAWALLLAATILIAVATGR
jgi:adenosylcobinamide-phosphate synthase